MTSKSAHLSAAYPDNLSDRDTSSVDNHQTPAVPALEGALHEVPCSRFSAALTQIFSDESSSTNHQPGFLVAPEKSELEGRFIEQTDRVEFLMGSPGGPEDEGTPLSAVAGDRAEEAIERSNRSTSDDAIGGPSSSIDSDRRTYPRRESECTVLIYRGRGNVSPREQEAAWSLHGSQIQGELVDVSMNGIAFELNEPLERDEFVLLRLSKYRFDQVIDKKAVVVRSVSIGQGQWKAVCRLTEKLSLDEVHILGNHLEKRTLI